MRMFRESAREEFIRREEVDGATEMFLTNSWLGVMPVATIEGRRLQCEIGREVLDAYRQEFSIP
jgi:branched-subunit amino acid aminotransferase/4-amino-4-deoxychorismate lyase